MPSASKEVHRTYQQRHYSKNKQYYKDKRAERRKLTLKRLEEFKNLLSCALCPEDYNTALDFHHIDAEQKVEMIYRMAYGGVSWTKIVVEMEKCVCVCSNCHRKIHKHEEWSNKLKPEHRVVVPESLK